MPPRVSPYTSSPVTPNTARLSLSPKHQPSWSYPRVLCNRQRLQTQVKGTACARRQLLVHQHFQVRKPHDGHLVHEHQRALEHLVQNLPRRVGDAAPADLRLENRVNRRMRHVRGFQYRTCPQSRAMGAGQTQATTMQQPMRMSAVSLTTRRRAQRRTRDARRSTTPIVLACSTAVTTQRDTIDRDASRAGGSPPKNVP